MKKHHFAQGKIISCAVVIVITFALIAILFFLSNQGEKETNFPKLTKGILNLQDVSFDNSQDIKFDLNGDWFFCWRQLLMPGDIQEGHLREKVLVKVPEVWNNYKLQGEPATGFGYATFYIKVNVKDPTQPISLYMPTIATSYRLFAGGR